jgi:hypothetical protein
MEALAKKGFFKPGRFGQLLFRDFTTGYKGTLIAMAAVSGAVLVIAFLSALGNFLTGGNVTPDAELYFGFFTNVLFLGGLIVTSLAFKEAHMNGGGIFYMTIPASRFEKLASKLLVTSIGYSVGVLALMSAVAALSEAVVRICFGLGFGFFNPFALDVLRCIGGYLIAQSLFLLGSLWFKKLAFVKTSLVILIGVIILGIVAAVAARILLADHFSWNSVQVGDRTASGMSLDWSKEYLMGLFGPGTRGGQGLRVFEIAGKIMFCGLLAPVCWLASYFRLGEIEV